MPKLSIYEGLSPRTVERLVNQSVTQLPRCRDWSNLVSVEDLRDLAHWVDPRRVAKIETHYEIKWSRASATSVLDHFFCVDCPIVYAGHYLAIDLTQKFSQRHLQWKLRKARSYAPFLSLLLGEDINPVIWGITRKPSPDGILAAAKRSVSSDIVFI